MDKKLSRYVMRPEPLLGGTHAMRRSDVDAETQKTVFKSMTGVHGRLGISVFEDKVHGQ